MSRSRFAVLVLALLSCTRSAPPRTDTVQAPRSSSGQDVQLSADASKVMDSIKRTVSADPNAPASKQRNLMTAPIDVIPVGFFTAETLRWVASPDNCTLLVQSLGPTEAQDGTGSAWVLASEARGTMGPGGGREVSPSPDWKWIARTSTMRLPGNAKGWREIIEADTPTFEVARQAAERRADGTSWISFAMVEPWPLSDDCIGDAGCPLAIVSPIHGSHVGWTSDSRHLLVTKDSSTWTAIDPETRQPVAGITMAPHALKWASRSLATTASADVTGGPYRFTSRGDSVFVRGPDSSGRVEERFVGAGLPVTVTRNGQYVLAVRREDTQTRAVVYAFRLFHALMRTSCD